MEGDNIYIETIFINDFACTYFDRKTYFEFCFLKINNAIKIIAENIFFIHFIMRKEKLCVNKCNLVIIIRLFCYAIVTNFPQF